MRPAEERAAIKAGCLASERSKLARAAYGYAVPMLVRAGHADFFRPQIRERAIHRKLHDLARNMDTRTGGGWLLHVVLSRGPAAFSVYLRRNRAWLDEQILAATNTT